MVDPPKRAQEGDIQCTAIVNNNQCPFVALTEGGRCAIHGGYHQLRAAVKQEAMYRLGEQYRRRVDHLTGHKEHFALNEELGIMRMLLEEALTSYSKDSDLLLRGIGPISQLIEKIEKLVGSAMKAEKYVGGLLTRSQAIQMLQEAVNAIAEEITDPDIIAAVAMKLEAIAQKTYEDQE